MVRMTFPFFKLGHCMNLHLIIACAIGIANLFSPSHAKAMDRQQAIKTYELIADMYRSGGQAEYFGENVTQLEHALQCAYLAFSSDQEEEVVIAALFHDIGHLIPMEPGSSDAEQFRPLGNIRHQKAGAAFLEQLGFSSKVCELVRSHVDAKRYLCFSNPAYYEGLSNASKLTLEYQGGPMDELEARAFEADPLFQLKIVFRLWDEQAKVPGLAVPGLDCYAETIISHLTCQRVNWDVPSCPLH